MSYEFINSIINGDCIKVMKEKIKDNSIDFILTDTKYYLINKSGSGFMNCKWDSVEKENIEQMKDSAKELKTLLEIQFDDNNFPFLNEIKEQILKSIPISTQELLHMKVRKFHTDWLNQAYRVLKAGKFIAVTYTTRLDSVRDILNSLYESKFNFNFSPLFWTYNTGFMKGQSQITAWDSKLFNEWLVKRDLKKVYDQKNDEITKASEKFRELQKKSTNEEEIQKQENIKDNLTLDFELWKLEEKKVWAKEEYNLNLIFTFEEHWNRKNREYQTSANIFTDKRKEDIKFKKTLPNFKSDQYSEYNKMMSGYKGDRVPDFNSFIVIDYSKHHRESRTYQAGTFKEKVRNKKSPLGDGKIESKAISNEARKMQGYYSGFQPSPSVELTIVAMKDLGFKCPKCNEIIEIKYLNFESGKIHCGKCNYEGKGKKTNYMEQGLQNFGGVTKLNRIPLTEEEKKKEYSTDRNYQNGSSGFAGDYKEGNWDQNASKKAFGMSNNSEEGRFMSNIVCSDDMLKNDMLNNELGSSSKFYDIDLWFKEYLSKIKTSSIKGFKTLPFVQVPKPSELEKDLGLEEGVKKTTRDNRKVNVDYPSQRGETVRTNFHPTIKPVSLGCYLLEIFSREGDLVLDCFAGSSSFLISSIISKRNFVGIEMEKDFINLSNKRINAFKELIKIYKRKYLSYEFLIAKDEKLNLDKLLNLKKLSVKSNKKKKKPFKNLEKSQKLDQFC
jgi:DNA modification methylase